MKLLIFSIFGNIICGTFEEKSTDNYENNMVKIHFPAYLFENKVGKMKFTVTIDVERESEINENHYEKIDNNDYMIMTKPKTPPELPTESLMKFNHQRSFSDGHSSDINKNDDGSQPSNSNRRKTLSFSSIRSFSKKKSSKNNKTA